MSVYQQIIKYLHTQKNKLDPLTMYMLMLNKDYFYYYCLLHPEVFTDDELYQQFIRLYVLNHSFRRETIDYYHSGQSADFDFNLNNHLRDKLNYNYNRIRNNRDITHNINIELDIQKEQNDDQKNLFDKYKNHHEKNLENIPEDTNPDDIDDLSKVQEILDKYNKKLDKLEKKVNKDLENRVDWTQERMKQKNRSKFKIWLQTPNPKTRHTSNDGQIVPLDEKFIVVNDKTGDIDYMDYPGDVKGSIGNIANCLCTIGFDKDITPEQLRKYKDYEKTRKQQKQKSKIIKQRLLFKKEDKETYKIIKEYNIFEVIDEAFKKVNKDNLSDEVTRKKINKYIKDETGRIIKSPSKIAKLRGYVYKFDSKKGGHIFIHKDTNMEIVIPSFYESNKLIDMRAKGEGKYTLNEILSDINLAIKIYPVNTDIIKFRGPFTTNYMKDEGKLGRTTPKITRNGEIKTTIEIAPNTLETPRNKDGNFLGTLFHEYGHVLDMKSSTPQQIKEKKYALSSSQDFEDVLKLDILRQKDLNIYDEFLSTEVASDYGKKNNSENFAEACTMAAYSFLDDKNGAVLIDVYNEEIRYKKWTKIHENLFEFCKRKIIFNKNK